LNPRRTQRPETVFETCAVFGSKGLLMPKRAGAAGVRADLCAGP
jgi:hypothetical protein